MTTAKYQPRTNGVVPGDLHQAHEILRLRPMITGRHLRTLRETGQLGVWRLGGKVYISLAELDALFVHDQREPEAR